MADLKVLMVFDGGRLNFGDQPSGDFDADWFGVSHLYATLKGSTTPTFEVHRAHRRGATFTSASLGNQNPFFDHENCAANLDIAGDFVFAMPKHPTGQVTADLSQYDVLWLIGDEGKNGGSLGVALPGPGNTEVWVDTEITDDEKIAISNFMASGGGVFSTGDHDAIGRFMCGYLPRVRVMRRWYEYDEGDGGGSTVAIGNGQKVALNWSSSWLQPGFTDRNDTLMPDQTDGLFYFTNQSDQTPQTLRDAAGNQFTATTDVHALLRDRNGDVIVHFPDHMHEGVATDFTTLMPAGQKFSPNVSPGVPYALTFNGDVAGQVSFPEFPSPGGYQPEPEVIAYTSDSGHETFLDGYEAVGGETASQPKTATGAVSVYDGRGAGVGRIVTGSTFHHYLDKNLIGDPRTVETYATAGHGPTGSDTGFQDLPVLTSIGDYYINTVTWLARPSQNFHFLTVKSTFGAHEAAGSPSGFDDAFYLVVEGFSQADLGNPQPTFSGALEAAGVTFKQLALLPDDPGDHTTPQRILIAYRIKPIPAAAFPAAGQPPKVLPLEAQLTVGGQALAAEALFELTADPDPFFINVAGSPPNAFYLSQDLRVFEFAPGVDTAPIISWQNGWGGHDYMTQLLKFLNDPSNGYVSGAHDAIAKLNESGDLSEASSVTPTKNGATNYGFAIAKLQLKSATAATAKDVRVFFRLFTTASNDTDFDPAATYPSTLDAAGLPGTPLNGANGTTFVMTASPSVGGDYPDPGSAQYPGPNARDIQVGANSTAYAYFGCYLDVYGASPPIPAGGHHCLVAQIADDQAPILAGAGLTASPETSDKLAQRNIVFATSGNPGGPDAHLVPHTFDTRPSRRIPQTPVNELLGYPDELMIDFGDVPIGTVASIYWPQAAAIDVVRLATLLYPSHSLAVEDVHTVRFQVTRGLTYVPIPFAAAGKLGGLFTLQLPQGVKRGQSFDVVVRRISTRQPPPPIDQPRIQRRAAGTRDARRAPPNPNWRYVVGSFQLTVPVETEAALLWPEENVLAIFKWRLEHLPKSDRWYPVLLRYLGYLERRVTAFGGDPVKVLPSPTGAPPPKRGGRGGDGGEAEHTGKVLGVVYDRFGDFEGFELETLDGERRAYPSLEPEIGELALRALRERLLISVYSDAEPPHEIRRIIVRI